MTTETKCQKQVAPKSNCMCIMDCSD